MIAPSYRTYHTVRAAYWVSNDGQSDILLTSEEQSDLPDEQLIDAAVALADDIDLSLTEGRIVIGEYTLPWRRES